MQRRALSILWLLGSIALGGTVAHAQPECLVTLLPYPGHTESAAQAVNGARPATVVGHSTDPAGIAHAARWIVAEQTECGTPILPTLLAPPSRVDVFAPHGSDGTWGGVPIPMPTFARDVDDAGRIVGSAVVDPQQHVAALEWDEDTVTVLPHPTQEGIPPMAGVMVTSTSSDGTIGGYAPYHGVPVGSLYIDHAWVGGDIFFHIHDLAFDASLGLVAAGSVPAAGLDSSRTRAAVGRRLGSDRSWTQLYGVAGQFTMANGVALREPDDGAPVTHAFVVGYEQGPPSRPMRWTVSLEHEVAAAGTEALAVPAGAEDGVAYRVDRRGHAVGWVGGRAAAWAPDGTHEDLAALEGLGGMVLQRANDIGEWGVIVGAGTIGDEPRGFALLPPVEDPTGPGVEVPAVQLLKTGPEEVPLGGTLLYTFWLTNESDETLEVELRDPLPGGTAFDPAANPGWSLDGGILVRSVTVPPASASGAVRVELRLDATAPAGETLVNDAYVLRFEDGTERVVEVPVATLVVDEPLVVELLGLAQCEEVPPGVPRTLEAIATDPDHALEEVAITVDGAVVASGTASPLTFDWPADGGFHCVQAHARSASGDAASSTPVCVQGDASVPSYTLEVLDSPAPGADGEGYGIGESGEVVGSAGDEPCRWTASSPVCLDASGAAIHVDASGRAAVTVNLQPQPAFLFNTATRIWNADGTVTVGPGAFLHELTSQGHALHSTALPHTLHLQLPNGTNLNPPLLASDLMAFFPLMRPRLAGLPWVSGTRWTLASTGPFRWLIRPFRADLDHGTIVLASEPGAYARINASSIAVGFLDLVNYGVGPAPTGSGLVGRGPVFLPPARHAARWVGAGPAEDLHQLGERSHAADISEGGLIVGAFASGEPLTEDSRAFLHTCDQQFDLNDTVAPGAEWTLRTANAVNDAGQITGRAEHPDGRVRAYRLDPAP